MPHLGGHTMPQLIAQLIKGGLFLLAGWAAYAAAQRMEPGSPDNFPHDGKRVSIPVPRSLAQPPA